MKKELILIIILITILINSGCINNNKGNGSIEPNYSELIIEVTSTSDFYILVPVIFDPSTNQSIEIIYNNLKLIEGKATFEIQNTKYGFALNISGNNIIKLMSYTEKTEFLYYPFSMQFETQEEKIKGNIIYWCFFNSNDKSSADVNIDFTSTHDYGGYIASISDNVHNGWNVINGTASAGGA